MVAASPVVKITPFTVRPVIDVVVEPEAMEVLPIVIGKPELPPPLKEHGTVWLLPFMV